MSVEGCLECEEAEALLPVEDVLEYRKALALPTGKRGAIEWDAMLEEALDEVEDLRTLLAVVYPYAVEKIVEAGDLDIAASVAEALRITRRPIAADVQGTEQEKP